MSSGLKYEYYLTGELYSEVFVINGKREGEYKSYYKDGNIWIICNYINDIIHGEYKQYHQNGKLNLICIYDDNESFNQNIYYEDGEPVIRE